MQNNLEERIRERAHAIWVAQGYPEGLAEEHWVQAAAEIAQVDKLAENHAPVTPGTSAKLKRKTAPADPKS